MHVGAQVVGDGVRFRVWAPKRRSVHVVIGEKAQALTPEADGYFVRGVTMSGVKG